MAYLTVFKPVGDVLVGLVFNKDIQLKKTDHSLTLLFLGIAGGTHEGPTLSDTIIFAHIDPVQHTVALFSIPRDLWIPEMGAKINTAYATGQERDQNGIVFAKTVVEKMIGKPIDYVLVANFSGFVQLIDLLGGVDIQVMHALDDYEYPIEGKEKDPCGHSEEELQILATASSQLEAFPCRYKHIYFEKGLHHMNGERALEYVRSRRAKGDEGTDFARSRRQQEVISALKTKLLSLGTLSNPLKVFDIYNVVKENLDTNITTEEFDDFIRLAQKMKDAPIKSIVIDTGDDKEKRPGILANPPASEEYSYQWVLIPRRGNGDFSEIHTYVDCLIKGNACNIKEDTIQISTHKNQYREPMRKKI